MFWRRSHNKQGRKIGVPYGPFDPRVPHCAFSAARAGQHTRARIGRGATEGKPSRVRLSVFELEKSDGHAII